MSADRKLRLAAGTAVGLAGSALAAVSAHAAGQRVTRAWNATAVWPGPQVEVRNASYHPLIGTSGTVTFGFDFRSWTSTAIHGPAGP